MTPLETLMRSWLSDGTEQQKRHARDRIAAGFADAPPAPQPPPLLTRVANFAGAVVSHVAAGLPTLDDSAVAARLAVCAECDQRLPGGVCAGCGCHLATKARWADQDCPKGLWPKNP